MKINLLALASSLTLLVGCQSSETPVKNPNQTPMVSYQVMVDSLHTALSANRRAYEDLIFDRLGRVESVLMPKVQWREEKTIPFPSQMFTEGYHIAKEKKGAKFSFMLMSKYPLNRQNKPITEGEKAALAFVYANVGKNYYGEETIDNVRYFLAGYPEIAYARPCTTCHNNHANASKFDYKVNDIIGMMLIRYPITE